jgi:hypothetical protein
VGAGETGVVGRALVAERRRRRQRVVHDEAVVVREQGAQRARGLHVFFRAVQLVVQVRGREVHAAVRVSADGLTVAAFAVHIGDADQAQARITGASR